MKLTHDSTRCRIIRTVTVAEGPVLHCPGSSADRLFRVESITVAYVLTDMGWEANDIKVFGPVLKKDGTDSKNTHSGRVPWNWKTWPEWVFLKSVIDQLRPTGSAELPAV